MSTTAPRHAHFEASNGSIVGADAVIRDRVTLEADAVIGRGAKIATGRTIKQVPDGGQAV